MKTTRTILSVAWSRAAADGHRAQFSGDGYEDVRISQEKIYVGSTWRTGFVVHALAGPADVQAQHGGAMLAEASALELALSGIPDGWNHADAIRAQRHLAKLLGMAGLVAGEDVPALLATIKALEASATRAEAALRARGDR